MNKMTIIWLIVTLSELLAAFLIWRIWKSNDYLVMKFALSILALIPVVGTLGTLWIIGFPPAQPAALRDEFKYSSDVFNRWRHIVKVKDKRKRLRLAKSLIEQEEKDRADGSS